MRTINVAFEERRANLFMEFLKDKNISFKSSKQGSLIQIEFKSEWSLDFMLRWFENWLEED